LISMILMKDGVPRSLEGGSGSRVLVKNSGEAGWNRRGDIPVAHDPV